MRYGSICLYAIAFLSAAAVPVLSFLGKSGTWECLIIAVLVLLIANIDKIESFKASATGVEAKTRKLVKEAETAIDEIRSMSVTLARAVFSTIESEGRFGGAGRDDEKQAIKDQVLADLKKLGATKAQIDQVRDVSYPFACFDYAHNICRNIRPSTDKAAHWARFWEDHKGIGKQPSPAALREFLQAIGHLDTQRAQLVDDYAHYAEHKTHRSPERWKQRLEWGREQ
jgi:hypothetical protein